MRPLDAGRSRAAQCLPRGGLTFDFSVRVQPELRYETANLRSSSLTVAEQLPRYLRLQRGATPAFRANSLDLFRQFADAKYKTFDLEKTRERDKEVLRQITKLAEDTRVNDQQRKELYAVQKQIEEKEKELAGRQAEMDKRKQEIDRRPGHPPAGMCNRHRSPEGAGRGTCCHRFTP